MTEQTRGLLFALGAFALFAAHDVLIKLLGGVYSPFQIVFFSVLFSFPLSTVMLMRDAEPGTLRPVHPWWMALRTAAIVCASGSAFFAFTVLPLADTYALLFAMPILVTLLAIPILGETVRLRRGLAIGAGLLGVMIVLQPGQADLNIGHAAAVFAACCSALASIVVRKVGRAERSVSMMLYPAMATFLVMGAAMPFVYKPMAAWDLGMNALIAALAFAAMLLTINAYRHAEAALVAPMQYSQMLWALLYGWLIFEEWPGGTTFLGVALIIASGLYIVFREARGGSSTHTPVLRTRSRIGTPAAPRISAMLRHLRLKR